MWAALVLCAVNGRSVTQLADFLRLSKAFDLRSVLEQCGHWPSELVSQYHRRVAAELPAALNVYGAFTLSRQMFMAGLATFPILHFGLPHCSYS
jgi:hypothetical protein